MRNVYKAMWHCRVVYFPLFVDPFYNAQDLHKTLIRNEAAYYGCICRVGCALCFQRRGDICHGGNMAPGHWYNQYTISLVVAA